MGGLTPISADAVALPDGETLGGAVRSLARGFQAAGIDTPALDARRLAEAATGGDALLLVREPERVLSVAERRGLVAMAERRLRREPVSRIVGHRAFRGLELEISTATLDPRPETEVLVDGVLELLAKGLLNAPGLRILDLGTGSGALLIALLSALPGSVGVGVDISPEALQVARRNARRHGLGARATFQAGDWLDGIGDRFGLIVSNPPYIASGEIEALDPEVRLYDPAAALDGGSDGLDCYRRIASGLGHGLAGGGWVAVEVGQGQAPAVDQILRAAISPVGRADGRTWRDLSGTERGVAVRARD